MKTWVAVFGIVAVCWSGGVAKAELSLQLSSPDDLMGLSVGDTATVNVSLVGLVPGEQLVSLTGSVLFPDALLGTPLSVSPGSIVPNPGDFFGVALAGQADGLFLTFSADPVDYIASNGVFCSFDVQAQAVGSGVFAFEPLALIAEQYNPDDPFLPILRDVQAGPELSFNVVPVFPALYLGVIGLAVAGKKLRAAIR